MHQIIDSSANNFASSLTAAISEYRQISKYVIPKPGVRGSIPFRDAILHPISDRWGRTGMNSRAPGRRIHGLRTRFLKKELYRGYRVVTSSTDGLANGGATRPVADSAAMCFGVEKWV